MTSSPAVLRSRTVPQVAHYPPGATFGPRLLHDFEFVWLLSGTARWECLVHDGREIVHTTRSLEPGTLLLSRPGMRDRFVWDRDQPCAHAYVHFFLDDRGTLPHQDTWPLTRPLSTHDPLAALCRYLLWLGGASAPGASERALDVLGWLLELFVNGPVADDVLDTLPEHIARVGDYLRGTWRGEAVRAVSLAEMAGAAGISRGHLTRLFRRRFGIGPVAAVDLVRLARAAILLQRSNLTVEAIAEVCGFANPFHFSRRFRRVYQIAPSTYRTQHSHDDPLGPVNRAGLLPLARPLLLEEF